MVVAALIVVVAVTSTGFTAQKLDLGDAAVWVSNGSKQAVGRANTEVLELNSVVSGTGSDVDVLQGGSTVLALDHGTSKLDIIDPATSAISDSVPLPPSRPQVYLAGDTAVILARGTGQLWITPVSQLSTFDAEATPTLSLGADTIASMDDDGRMFVYSPTAGAVYRIDPEVSDAVRSTDKVTIPATGDLSITSAGARWVVLDATARLLYTADGTASVPDLAAAAILQQPGGDATRVLVADSTGVYSAALPSRVVTKIDTGRSGTAAAPLISGGCVFTAWTSGQAWRQCANDPAEGSVLPLSAMPANAELGFHSNGDRVLLNDGLAGDSWAVQASGELINNWAELIPPDADQSQQDNNEDTPPEQDKIQQPPVAVDDSFGARPGRASVLPVLLNDYDPNGDVLAIDSVGELDGSFGHIDLINDGQQLQITVTDEASGSATIRYTISDGRGGTASASVKVTVRTPAQNSPPQQVRSSTATVATGGRVTTQVLGDWVDPDGDAFFLSAASAPAPNIVTSRPQGSVVFTDSGSGAALKQVAIVVSDGSAEGTGTIAITVRAQGKVPIVADPFIVVVTANSEVTVLPLEHVRGGTGAVRLNSVPARTGSTVTPSYEAGSFRFTSSQVGTHYLDYVVTDGDLSATGVVRVEVISPPDANAKPVTIPKTVFVRSLQTERVDVAGTDIDPAGGVLLVTGISGLPTASGVSTEVLEQRYVQVRLSAPIDQPVTFNYTVSNGLAEAQGIITVIEIASPSRLQPPVANDDEITVRVGAAIDIPVLDNDEHPDGEALTLLPTLARGLPSGAGLLFGSGRVLRYLAPDHTGNFTAVYQVDGPDGQSARAQVRIAVREADVATNNAPVPSPIVARALAGETVTIAVPLSGIDPDGDSVQLIGQATNPQKGSVVSVDADSITYRAGDYSVGTDSFTYTVVDALGARATGTVRVGITARADGARNPVAILDEITVRPGVTVSVQVLANDSDPDGRPLHVVSVVPNDPVTRASVANELVSIRPPDVPGTYGVVYTIDNGFGGTSSNFVRVTVDPNAPLAFPVAGDTVLTLTDILDHPTVDVAVLGHVFFADGSPSALGVTIDPAYSSRAQVLANKRVRVTVENDSQIIPFRVSHPQDPNVFSYAFIWVPGFRDALPQLNRNAPALTVASEAKLVIHLNDYVLAVGDKTVRLTDAGSVTATHSNGTNLVVGPETLTFTSADRYFGAASISFEVTDGESADDPNGHTAILVLPITVLPRENQPPTFAGAVLEVEPAESKQIDLVRLTNYPYPDDTGELVYTVLSPLPVGFTYALSGHLLTLRANESAATGSITNISIGVRDSASTGQAGRIQLNVVPSTKPLATAATDVTQVRRGETSTVDVLANDAATNPFPATPLRVVAIRGVGGNQLPKGIAVSPSRDKSELAVTVAASAKPGETELQYQIADATDDPNRYVWGTVRISVQDRPDPVSNVRVASFADRQLTVAWNSGSSNNSPLTGYHVDLADPATGAVLGSADCAGAQCEVATPGNGPDNAVRIVVVAKNAVGDSDPAQNATNVWSDVVPDAPANVTATPLDHGFRVRWAKPVNSGGGSEITKYVLDVDGLPTIEVSVNPLDAPGTQYSRTVTDPGIANGSTVAFSISSRNSAASTLASWKKATGAAHPAGDPDRKAAPTASADIGEGTTATLTWPGGFSDDGRPITEYFAAVYTNVAPLCTVAGDLPGLPQVGIASPVIKHVGTATSTTFTGLAPDTRYKFVVFAFNGMGCTSSVVVEATPRARPGTVTSISTLAADGSSTPEPNGDFAWDYKLRSFTTTTIASRASDTFIYKLSGGSIDGTERGPRTLGSFLTADGQQYGERVSVQVKACRTYSDVGTPLCSANWSAPFPVGVPVSNSALGGQNFTQTPGQAVPAPDPTDPADPPVTPVTTPATGQYSWTSAPAGNGYDAVTYSCGGGESALGSGAGTCDVTESTTTDDSGTAVPTGDFPSLTVTITANGTQYVRTYTWQSFHS
ncbi:Ig-like domain-containing protein [Glaciihabitans sp. dw_435]|uniref:Ig-like domain-containing protein n=1 Tax=Glaciihabitans sp. dw_435 TaxID=2720081 RepID=UPI001BD22927|nr:tandem-95 repeat protein [Glaciihabitans sp. dw_435]